MYERPVAALPLAIPLEFKCPLSLEIMEDPVIAADNHSYERRSIEHYFASGQRQSPRTQQFFIHLNLIPDTVLRQTINLWKEQIQRQEVALAPPSLPSTQSVAFINHQRWRISCVLSSIDNSFIFQLTDRFDVEYITPYFFLESLQDWQIYQFNALSSESLKKAWLYNYVSEKLMRSSPYSIQVENYLDGQKIVCFARYGLRGGMDPPDNNQHMSKTQAYIISTAMFLGGAILIVRGGAHAISGVALLSAGISGGLITRQEKGSKVNRYEYSKQVGMGGIGGVCAGLLSMGTNALITQVGKKGAEIGAQQTMQKVGHQSFKMMVKKVVEATVTKLVETVGETGAKVAIQTGGGIVGGAIETSLSCVAQGLEFYLLLLSADFPFSEKDLSQFPDLVYIRHNNNLFYICKKNRSCFPVIALNLERLSYFDLQMEIHLLTPNKPRKLSALELEKIQSITGHIRDGLLGTVITAGLGGAAGGCVGGFIAGGDIVMREIENTVGNVLSRAFLGGFGSSGSKAISNLILGRNWDEGVYISGVIGAGMSGSMAAIEMIKREPNKFLVLTKAREDLFEDTETINAEYILREVQERAVEAVQFLEKAFVVESPALNQIKKKLSLSIKNYQDCQGHSKVQSRTVDTLMLVNRASQVKNDESLRLKDMLNELLEVRAMYRLIHQEQFRIIQTIAPIKTEAQAPVLAQALHIIESTVNADNKLMDVLGLADKTFNAKATEALILKEVFSDLSKINSSDQLYLSIRERFQIKAAESLSFQQTKKERSGAILRHQFIQEQRIIQAEKAEADLKKATGLFKMVEQSLQHNRAISGSVTKAVLLGEKTSRRGFVAVVAENKKLYDQLQFASLSEEDWNELIQHVVLVTALQPHTCPPQLETDMNFLTADFTQKQVMKFCCIVNPDGVLGHHINPVDAKFQNPLLFRPHLHWSWNQLVQPHGPLIRREEINHGAPFPKEQWENSTIALLDPLAEFENNDKPWAIAPYDTMSSKPHRLSDRAIILVPHEMVGDIKTYFLPNRPQLQDQVIGYIRQENGQGIRAAIIENLRKYYPNVWHICDQGGNLIGHEMHPTGAGFAEVTCLTKEDRTPPIILFNGNGEGPDEQPSQAIQCAKLRLRRFIGLHAHSPTVMMEDTDYFKSLTKFTEDRRKAQRGLPPDHDDPRRAIENEAHYMARATIPLTLGLNKKRQLGILQACKVSEDLYYKFDPRTGLPEIGEYVFAEAICADLASIFYKNQSIRGIRPIQDFNFPFGALDHYFKIHKEQLIKIVTELNRAYEAKNDSKINVAFRQYRAKLDEMLHNLLLPQAIAQPAMCGHPYHPAARAAAQAAPCPLCHQF